jgi:hypothetical protein
MKNTTTYETPCDKWKNTLKTKIINNILHYQVDSMKHVMDTHVNEYYWTHVSDWKRNKHHIR